MPRTGRKARSSSAGAWRPTTAAIVPMPMAMLVVAAVLEAAMATPSTTPRERRRSGLGAEERGGLDDMVGSSGTEDEEEGVGGRATR
ncbi:hypothetical protein RKD46_001216 [Streptomyces pseudovenezuelae]